MWLQLLLAVGLAVAYGAKTPVQPPIRVDMAPPPPPESHLRNSPASSVHLAVISMKVDHFDPLSDDKFQMRYMYNGDYFGGDGHPIFIMVGGEWSISDGWLRTGNMYEMAKENKGFMFYTEHRYYGQSQPVLNWWETTNLRYLNVDQALADLAFFIGFLKDQPRFKESKIILYGGSYAANMVTWFKQRYPHLVKGVVASSGPIKAEVDFTGYLETVHNAFESEGGEQCLNIIRQGVIDTVEAMKTEAGRRTLEEAFRLCGPLDYDNLFDLAYFEAGLITWSFSGAVQQAYPGSIKDICNALESNAWGSTPMQKLGGFTAWRNGLSASSCWTLTYDALLGSYSQPSEGRMWFYQTCTEYGYYQTAPRSGTVFDPLVLVDVDFYVDICQKVFDEKFDKAFVNAAVDRVNTAFGGLNPNVNNTITIHGQVDPWHALGVVDKDLKESSPTYLVKRASHCFDMRSWQYSDTIKMSQVQQTARRIVASWLNEE